MSNNESFIGFLSNLDYNLTKSLESFNNIQILPQSTDKILLQLLLNSINSKLNQYIECLAPYSNETSTPPVNLDYREAMIKHVSTHKNKKEKGKGQQYPSTLYKTINMINETDISPNKINLRIINNLSEMTPMFYWYKGDKYHKEGIFTCVSDGFYVRIPFPSTVSTLNNNFKLNSIPCKYETREFCSRNKKYISDMYQTELRECSYVHKKEKFEKIGSIYKCSIESFGNHENLKNDLDLIDIRDIKRLLFYSVSDLLLANIWYQNKFNNGQLIISNLEIM